MPLFKVEVFKSWRGERWGNVYGIEAPDIDVADGVAGDIVGTEQSFHLEDVLFESVRTSDTIPGTDVFITSPLNIFGTRTLTGEAMPLWDTLRADLSVGVGRPGRKYYRGVLTEADQVNSDGTIDSTLRSTVESSLNALVGSITSGGATWVQPDGDPINSAAVFPKVQMRQLHRKRRRSTTP